MKNRIGWTGFALALAPLTTACDTEIVTPAGDSETDPTVSSDSATSGTTASSTVTESDTVEPETATSGVSTSTTGGGDTGSDSTSSSDSTSGSGSDTTTGGQETGSDSTGTGPECTKHEDCPLGLSCSADMECVPCGDGIVGDDEECDDGNLSDADSCSSTCQRTIAEAVVSSGKTCILTIHGDVKCWGSGLTIGQGNPETIGDDETPASIGFIDLGAPAIDITAGGGQTCAALETGDIRCWGTNSTGGLGTGQGDTTIGDDEPVTSIPPVQHAGLDGAYFVAVDMAWFPSPCGLLNTGGVRCWGDPRGLGYNTGYEQSLILPITNAIGDDETPAEAGYGDVDIGLAAVEIMSGQSGHIVRTSSGSLRAWGGGAFGHTVSVGVHPEDPTVAEYGDLPFDGIEMTNVDFGTTVACSVQADGTLYCWGYGGGHGALGILGLEGLGSIQQGAASPTITEAGPVDVGGPVAFVESQRWSTCAVRTDGEVRCWGQGSWGQNGRGTTDDPYGNTLPPSAGPATDLGEGSVVAFAEGKEAEHFCALLENGDLKCWGYNGGGVLGYGHTDNVGDEPGEMGAALLPVDIF